MTDLLETISLCWLELTIMIFALGVVAGAWLI